MQSTVRTVGGSEVAGLVERGGWRLLDVRSPREASKVAIRGALRVPLFVESESNDPVSVLGRLVHLTMGGGWWLGGTHMVPNKRFVEEVRDGLASGGDGEEGIKVVVVCQRGLRSLQACMELSRALKSSDSTELAWVDGGCDKCRRGELPTEVDGIDPRYAGIGGLSETLGWTAVQREDGKELLGGPRGVLSAFAVLLALDAALFLVEIAGAVK